MTNNGAVISADNLYRYCLWRTWDTALPKLGFIMLNPSTADATKDDATIRKCIGFAKLWKYGSIVVTNMFAFRSRDPEALKTAKDPVGPNNDQYLASEAMTCQMTIAAWGIHGHLLGRDQAVLSMMKKLGTPLHHLGLTKADFPRHPLYRPYSTVPQLLWKAA